MVLQFNSATDGLPLMSTLQWHPSLSMLQKESNIFTFINMYKILLKLMKEKGVIYYKNISGDRRDDNNTTAALENSRSNVEIIHS